MSVYVDPLMDYGWKLGASCHMYADSLKELHAAAIDAGLKTSWFQVSKLGIPHYDLTESRRKRAIRQGAIEFTPTLDDLKRFKATAQTEATTDEH